MKTKKTTAVKKAKIPTATEKFLDECFPICWSRDGFVINLGGMLKYAPTGKKWGFAPFEKRYKTLPEAKKVRKEMWKTIFRWVDYSFSVL